MKSLSLHQSYHCCEDISRRQASNFYPAFRVLPAAQKRAMCALYAFLRIADDLSDEPGEPGQQRQALIDWRAGLRSALHGDYTHPIHAALHHTVETFHIPDDYLYAALDGVEMDLAPCVYTTFDQLRRYCHLVASVVGLSCIEIWGYSGAQARDYAESAGIAFQLTNILRDLGEDAARGRLYLPLEDLERFNYDPERLARGQCDDDFRALMRFEVERARQFYRDAWPLVPLLRPAGRAVFLVMARTYHSLLNAIERRNYDVFRSRVRLSRWHKLFLALRAVPVRCGWLPMSVLV